MAAASSSSMTATLTGTHNVCFNFNCKLPLERSRKGWRRRTGDFADLCDRCSSAYEEGKFCETFHLNSSGWRCCESCGKQIHCGCIVSFHMFVLLDAGGIECITCARKSFILTPNPAWPPPSVFLPLQSERIKDVSVRNWSPIAGSGPVPWRQAPSLFNSTSIQIDLQSRVPTEVDGLRLNERLSSSSMEKQKLEDSFDRLMNCSLNISCLDVKRGTHVSSGEEQPSSSLNQSQQIGHSTTPGFSLVVGSVSKNETDDHAMVAGTMHQPTDSQVEKQSCNLNPVDIFDAQSHNLKAKGDAKGRSQLLSRYLPRISEEELQRISEDSNSVITPLFEKMLSASDAGKIGRLVLPKKCAEAYLPPISQPEGLPLKVQDSKGKEWVFQFRFWPNNNSRMYVLEGITPCIQSMQLQAGDIVTFSRIEPEGKLVMGCRKVSAATSEKGNGTSNSAPKSSSNGEIVGKGKKAGESAEYIELAQTNLPTPVNPASLSFMPLNQQIAEPSSAWCDADKQGQVGVKANSSAHGKKKNGTVGLKRKRLKIDNEDVVELKVSWEQVQGLLRPPPNKDPTVFVIDGCEFEEFEDAPVIGRPTIPATDCHGKRVQWVQCEKCFKWRELPADALLKSSWTCSENLWDTARSLCSADEELTSEKLEALLPTMSCAASEKMKDPLQDPESIEALEGLDALANVAIQENATSSQTRTKHPRHKPGCSCIVCLQPPSGKGPKHKKPCDCVVCKSLKRRNETLMLKREQKQSEKEPETGCQKSQHEQSCEDHCKIGRNRSLKEEDEEQEEGPIDECPDSADEQSPASPLKGSHIDLNIQPDREEELSVSFYSGSSSGTLPDTKEENLRHQRLSEYIRSSMGSSEARLDTKVRHQRLQRLSEYVKSSATNQAQQDEIRHTNTNNSMQLGNLQIVCPRISSPKGIIASTTHADS